MISRSIARIALTTCALAVTAVLAAPAVLAADAVPAYIQAAVADASRPAADKERDVNRKPAESVAFAGVKQGDKVGELMPGGGYFTRVLSKAVGAKGVVYAMAPTPAAPPAGAAPRPNALATLAAEPGYGNIKLASMDVTAKLPEPVDVMWTSQNYHDFANRSDADLAALNKMVFDALKPGGVFLVIDHASAPGAGKTATRTLHRIDPEAVKKDLAAAGFVFESESKLLQNPKDPHSAAAHDASFRGMTDQFMLKFRKPK
jgi:predicted methyltransferase